MDPKNPSNPGETPPAPPTGTPPAAPAAEPQNPPTPPPTGSEPENNPGAPGAMVPSERLREETEKRRKAEEELEQLRNQPPPAQPQAQPDEDDELDPDVQRMLDGYVKKRGLVSQEELDGERLRLQVQQDVKDLESNPPVPGIAYDHNSVIAYANENGPPITSKAALRAAYREMNWDKILEAERQRTIAGVNEGNRGGAEQPGGGGATPPSEPAVEGKNPHERNRSRIRSALQKHTT
jgi:hypothetical protein